MAQVNLLVLYQHLEEAKSEKNTRSELSVQHEVKKPLLSSNDPHKENPNSIFLFLNYRRHGISDLY